MAQRDEFRPFHAVEGEWATRLTFENTGKFLYLWGQRNIPRKQVAEGTGPGSKAL